MPDLYELERRFRAANRELRDASDRLCAARDHLTAHPVTERAVQQYQFAKHVGNTLYEQYVEAKARLDQIDRDVDYERSRADRYRSQLNRKKFLTSPTGLTLIGSAEVLLVLLLSLICLINLPVGVWAILFLVAAFGAVALTVMTASIHRRNDEPRLEYLRDEIRAADEAAWDRGRGRANADAIVEEIRGKWEKAHRVYQEIKANVRPKVRFDQTQRDYDEALQHYAVVSQKYEQAQTERRLRLLHRNWRDLRDRSFESFVCEVFECLGFVTETTRTTGDQGIDVIATKDGVRWGIQCKGYSGNVGNDAVQQAYTGRVIYKCDRCMVITNSGFTSAAQEAAVHTGTILICGGDLTALIRGDFRLST